MYWVGGAALIALDQGTKAWATSTLSLYYGVVVVPGVLDFHLVHNFGAAYGLFEHQRVFLIGITLVVLIGAALFYRQLIQSRWSAWGLTFLIAGALGNLWDRVMVGYVTDYINIHLIPVFNIADMCINIGVGSFILESIITYRRSKS